MSDYEWNGSTEELREQYEKIKAAYASTQMVKSAAPDRIDRFAARFLGVRIDELEEDPEQLYLWKCYQRFSADPTQSPLDIMASSKAIDNTGEIDNALKVLQAALNSK